MKDTHIIQLPRDNLDLDQIGNSGQCFRWYKKDDGSWVFYVENKLCIGWMTHDTVLVETELDDEAVKHYFDMNTDYSHIISLIPNDDWYLRSAASRFSGVRILRQNLWETAVSFIVFQNINIPRIKRVIKLLCDECNGQFPSIVQLDSIDLESCGLGYRVKYLNNFADRYLSLHLGKSYEEDCKTLQTLYGVGPKVASCICLFGLHYLEACPIDRWVQSIINKRYGGTGPDWMNSPYAGVYQQYAFCYERWMNS